MKNSYNDPSAITQVIGCVFSNPSLLDETDKYTIIEEDFPEIFHKILFGSIYNIHMTSSEVTVDAIIDYLANRPKYEAEFKVNKGVEYLAEAVRNAKPNTFNYYYNRMKKFTLLRMYDSYGVDVSWLYDPMNVIDTKKRQEQEDWLDATSLVDIANKVDRRIEDIRSKFVDDDLNDGMQAGEGIDQLLADLQKHPEVGIPLYGPLINTVTRGARLRKFYLRSAPTGYGKTRSMIADAWNFAAYELWSEEFGMWIKNGPSNSTLFIVTEQDMGEFQTMSLAFISDVDEEHILNNMYEEGEWDRVLHAKEIIKNSCLWVEHLPDFSIQDVENKIKKHVREHDVKYILFDYLHTSMKILEEVRRRSGGIKLREDNVLFMLSTHLKDIANEYGVFVMSATQLNSDYQDSETPDQNLLRGAKSIADRIDYGSILLSVTDDDLKKIEPIMQLHPEFEPPNMKISIYKNRRGRYRGVYLFCKANLGTCRIRPMFMTDWRHQLQSIEDIKIMVEDDPAPWEEKG